MPAAPPPAADPAEPRALSSTAGGKSASSIPVLLARLQREEALLRQALDGKLQVPDGGKKLEETIAKLKRDLTDAGFDPSYATSPAAQGGTSTRTRMANPAERPRPRRGAARPSLPRAPRPQNLTPRPRASTPRAP